MSDGQPGKDLVKVLRVVREKKNGKEIHHCIEYTVRALLDGAITTSYTKADNTCVVTTDTCKNTVNYYAKTSPYVLDPAAFALHLGTHFVTRYDHITRAYIDLYTKKWSRIPVEGQPHKWAFVHDGDEKQTVSLVVDGREGKDKLKADLKMGLKDLLVMKTSGSAFENFYQDELTTLAPVADRIFSTSVTTEYSVPLPANIPLSMKTVGDIAAKLNFARISATVLKDTLEVFATDESPSVQATLYNTAQRVLTHCPAVQDIRYSLPNKHYIAVNLNAFKLDNGLGYEGGAEVFWPASDPSGLIEAKIARKEKAKL
ncbi:uricase (Urate oxidase) [Trichosporon asahii var. asahii CBS 8904]|uniref:Uricase n=1 Tax=Trichosporon asahii var. asahii (strain CBS 8904) TaxID=1220162 RepID=K1VK75_TRIAC|nr:uricase (Urate oxidase) [Trichosporon asahii var. asahii CBS 8904]